MVSVGFVFTVGGVWRVSALCWWCMVSVGFVLVVYGECRLCVGGVW